jgi:shikimate kinase
MNIVLIGYRGAGKSTVGKMLAARIKKKFVDADDLIEKDVGISISGNILESWKRKPLKKFVRGTI